MTPAEIIAAMRPDERRALEDGHRTSGHRGSLAQFFEEQAQLYRTAQEGDPRLKTFFYGDTLDKYHAPSVRSLLGGPHV